nr:transposase [Nitrosococcus watsonii]
MSLFREPKATVHFVDQYCAPSQGLFAEVRSFEQFKLLHLGLLAELPRKTLPAIARAVGGQEQAPHHFLSDSPWQAQALREQRLGLLRQALGGRAFVLCLDETGDRKKGKSTDYVARQYIGNLGKVDNGRVSANAYGVLDETLFRSSLGFLNRKSD